MDLHLGGLRRQIIHALGRSLRGNNSSSMGGEEQTHLEALLSELLPATRHFLDESYARLTQLDRALMPGDRTRALLEHQALVLPYFLETPFIRWTNTWPFGYPGDFRCVEMIFDSQPEGTTPLGQLLSRYTFQIGPCQAHRARLPWVHGHLQRLEEQSTRPLRVLSIACGPERVLWQYVANGRKCDITLLDADPRALELCRRRFEGKQSFDGLQVEYINLSVIKLVTDPSLRARLSGNAPEGRYDAILILGLLDYLDDELVQQLMGVLEPLMRPGGLLLATNLHQSNPWQAAMEYLANWSVRHRSKTGFGQLIGGGLPQSRLEEVTLDASGTNVFVAARRA